MKYQAYVGTCRLKQRAGASLSSMVANGRSRLAPLTCRQGGVKPIEFQALPGSEARALRAKTMKRASLLGPGGQAFLPPRTDLIRCRSARLGPRWARLILRKHGGIFGANSFPADAFFGQRACFRATSLFFEDRAIAKVGKLFEGIDRQGFLCYFSPGSRSGREGREKMRGARSRRKAKNRSAW